MEPNDIVSRRIVGYGRRPAPGLRRLNGCRSSRCSTRIPQRLIRSTRTVQAGVQGAFRCHALIFDLVDDAPTTFTSFSLGARADLHGLLDADAVPVSDSRGALAYIPGSISWLREDDEQNDETLHPSPPGVLLHIAQLRTTCLSGSSLARKAPPATALHRSSCSLRHAKASQMLVSRACFVGVGFRGTLVNHSVGLDMRFCNACSPPAPLPSCVSGSATGWPVQFRSRTLPVRC